MNKTLLIVYGGLAVVLVLCVITLQILEGPGTAPETPSAENPQARVNSFEECANAGYPIMESYPRQCNTSSGQHFTEIIPPIAEQGSSSPAAATQSSTTISTPTPTPAPKPREGGEGVACTMEAKMCPDGSYVGRTGPNCEFAPCPG